MAESCWYQVGGHIEDVYDDAQMLPSQSVLFFLPISPNFSNPGKEVLISYLAVGEQQLKYYTSALVQPVQLVRQVVSSSRRDIQSTLLTTILL